MSKRDDKRTGYAQRANLEQARKWAKAQAHLTGKPHQINRSGGFYHVTEAFRGCEEVEGYEETFHPRKALKRNFAHQITCEEHEGEDASIIGPFWPVPEDQLDGLQCDTCAIRDRMQDVPLSKIIASGLVQMQLEAQAAADAGTVSETRLEAFLLELGDIGRQLGVLKRGDMSALTRTYEEPE